MLVTHPASRLAMVAFIRPTAWKVFSKVSPRTMIRVKAKATWPYATPSASTDGDWVKAPRKAGRPRMHSRVSPTPWTSDRSIPWEAARSALSFSPAPRWKAMTALIPMPKPTPTAVMRFCTG